jgi:hypothetical protein
MKGILKMSKQYKKVVKEWPDVFSIKQNIAMEYVLCFNYDYYIIKENGTYNIYAKECMEDYDRLLYSFNTLYGAIVKVFLMMER